MPNFCLNRVVLLGDRRGVGRAWRYIQSCVRPSDVEPQIPKGLDFSRIVPIPPALSTVWKQPACSEVERRSLLKKFGTTSALDWCIEAWGQRLNFPQIHFEDPPSDSDYGLGMEAAFHFDTAWKPCVGIVAALSKRFPRVGFILMHDEPGNDLRGVRTFLAGVLVEECNFTGSSLLLIMAS